MPVIATLSRDYAPGRPAKRVKLAGEILDVAVAESAPTVGVVKPTLYASVATLRALGFDYVGDPPASDGTLTHLGTWSGARAYRVDDVVKAPNGKSYKATSPSTNAQPPGAAWTEVTVGTTSGGTVRSGTGVPPASLGVDGDYFLDSQGSRLYGPKAAGAWGGGYAIGDLVDGAVTAQKIAAGAVTEEKLDASGVPQRDAEMVLDTNPTTTVQGNGYVPGGANDGQVLPLEQPGMAVRVPVGGKGYDNAGKRKAIPTSGSLVIAAADPTNPRTDVVVVTSAGQLAVRQGTPAAQPAPPTLTAGDITLASVDVLAGATQIQAGNIKDLRVRKAIHGSKIKDGTIPSSAFQAWPRSTSFTGDGATTKFTLPGPRVDSMNNGYFGVIAFLQGARIRNVTPGVPQAGQYRVIEEANQTKVEMGAAPTNGQILLVDWRA